jgi:hypothetical protein
LEINNANDLAGKRKNDYLLREYNRILRVDTTALSQCYKQATLNGDGLSMMRYICKAYYNTTSVRSLIQGERDGSRYATPSDCGADAGL